MIYAYKDIRKLKDKLRGSKVAFTSGCFDLLHTGHLKMLADAKHYGDVLVVGVFPDAYVRQMKGGDRPVHTQRMRARILDALKSVDHVILLNMKKIEGKLPVRAVYDLHPSIYVTRSAQWKKYLPDLARRDIGIKLLRTGKINSTTEIIDKIRKSPKISLT